MKRTEKQFYEVPSAEAISLEQEGPICESRLQTAARQDYEWEEW